MRTFMLCCLMLAFVGAKGQIIHVPEDYSTIQQGIEAASPGDTVLVADGIYFEQINFLGKKPLLVTSNFIFDNDSTHLKNTILDGSKLPLGKASVVIFSEGTDTTSVISGFTIRNGKGTFDGHMTVGGGIILTNAGGKILNNRIIENTVNKTDYSSFVRGAGIGTTSDSMNWIVIRGNIISDNVCQADAYSHGGGMCLNLNVICESNVVSNNKAMEVGGIFFAGDNLIGKFILNKISNNGSISEYIPNFNGGGFAALHIDTIVFSKNEVKDNIMESYNYAGAAGALIQGGNAIVSGNNFNGNISHINTGYIFGGGVEINCQSATIEGNIFKANQAKGNWGEQYGGGLFAAGHYLMIKNNVFQLNENTTYGQTYGGAIYIRCDSNAWFINNAFSENTASSGGAIYAELSNSKFLNNVFWQDSGSEIVTESGTASFAYNIIDTGKIIGSFEILEGNILQNPLFCETNCLQPDAGSPCLNKGVRQFVFPDGDTLTAPEYDILGQLRPAGAGYDLGAYELHIEAIEEEKNQFDFLVYPNPFVNNLLCHYRLEEKSAVNITVYDMLGRQQSSWNKTQPAGEYNIPLDTELLKNGIYLVEVRINDSMVSKKVIKSNK